MRRRLVLSTIILVACLGGLAHVARQSAVDYGLRNTAGLSQERLRLLAATLSMRVERFRYLPEVVARSREIEQLFATAADPARVTEANELLARIAGASGAQALFVTDLNGLTIAASNHDQAGSFVGQNYSYRPYFRNALATGFGSYYAVGATTGQPGYFLAVPVRVGARTIGVSIVKIDLLPVERQWREAGETVAISDEQHIIFLSSKSDWRYTQTSPLSTAALARMKAERRYGDVVLGAPQYRLHKAGPYEIAGIGNGETSAQRLFLSMPFGNGWTINYFADLSPLSRQADMVALAATLAALLAVAAALIAFQQLRARRVARRMLVDLEARVDERTSALRSTNDHLEREIAERQEAERQLNVTRSNLTQAEKLAAIGQTFAGLAHEINQPLAALQTYISSTKLLIERRALDVAGANFDTMGDIVRRVFDLTNQLKRLARRNEDDFTQIDLAKTTRRTLNLLKFRFADLGITVAEDLEDKLCVVGSETQMDQVILNLLNNAIDAVRDRDERRIGVRAGSDGDFCVLAIDDNGRGIDPAARDHMFEPFHTTKAPGEGLGLGLATASRIVTDHHGILSANTSPLGGARFTVCLPRVGQPGREKLSA